MMFKSRRTWRDRAKCFVCVHLLLTICLVTSFASAASYDGKIDATLTVASPAVTNTFGFATFPGNSATATMDSGNIALSSPTATASLATLGVHGISDATGFTVAAPAAHAESLAETENKINLANLTGSGGPTPPAQVLVENLSLTFTYDLDVQAIPPDEDAFARIYVRVGGGGGAAYNFSDFLAAPPSAHLGPITIGPITIPVTLQPNSITSVFLWTQGYGFCDSVTPPFTPPPPNIPGPPPVIVPEPATFQILLLSVSLFALRPRGLSMGRHVVGGFC